MKNQISIFGIFILAFTIFGQLQAQPDYKLVEQDSLALVAFYWATDGPNWTSNQDGFGFDDLSSEWQARYDGGYNKWLDGPAKDWFGVKVEKRQVPNSSDSAYRVTWVWPVIGRRTDGQNALKGYIPREVGLLTALERFYVNGNNGLEWTEIPDDLYHASLTHLDIESANFGGAISEAFRSCVGMRKMNFRYNYIDYMPVLDFLDADALYNLDGGSWFYSTRLSYAILEKTIDHFYTISDNPKEFSVECRDLFDVGDEQEVVAALGSPVELECTSAGEREESITYQWFKNGLSMFGKTGRILSISSVKESDYADYTVKITNEYVKEYDQNSNYGEVFTKAFHLVAGPVPPVVEWAESSYNGKEITLRLSKPMNANAAGFEGFAIQAGARSLTATAARTEGRLNRDFVLVLSEPLLPEDALSIDYAGSEVIDTNGGALAAFAGTEAVNHVKVSPALISASTTKDGNGIKLVFDGYVDQYSINPDDFTVSRDGNGAISYATLFAGELDAHISKIVLLTLAEPISDSAEVLTVSYSEGELSGFLSGVVISAGPIDVSNEVSLELTEALLTFQDGSRVLENVMIQGSWRIDPIQMYDDGTHGDTVAADFNWASTIALVDDSYNWDVVSRLTTTSYDTARVEDPETGVITLVITPFDLHEDEVLSETVVLEFQVETEEVSGTTSYGIENIPVTFILSVDLASDELFLMGIDEDWGLGIPMEETDISKQYSMILPGYTVGDVIEYNYRDGSTWENQSVEPRSYVVVSGENMVQDHFGQFILSQEEDLQDQVSLYPNPVRNMLHLEGVGNYNKIEIFSISGQLLSSEVLGSAESYQTDISQLEAGLYLLKLSSGNTNNFLIKFMKY